MKAHRVGVIGSGPVGQSLAAGFIKHGFEVMIGSRNPDNLKDWNESIGNKAKLGNFTDVAKFGEILVLAVKGNVAAEALKLAVVESLGGKIIIDTTNPIAEAPPENGVLKFFTSLDESLMERLQKSFPTANFVKAFNIIGNSLMVDPNFNGEKPTMFIAGNSIEAKNDVTEILEKFGFEVEDMGGAEGARAIEPLCMLWCIPGFLKNQWDGHAFRLLKKY